MVNRFELLISERTEVISKVEDLKFAGKSVKNVASKLGHLGIRLKKLNWKLSKFGSLHQVVCVRVTFPNLVVEYYTLSDVTESEAVSYYNYKFPEAAAITAINIPLDKPGPKISEI